MRVRACSARRHDGEAHAPHAERLPKALTFGAVGLALSVFGACGTSMQSIHEGSIRFEHCYGLDFNPEIAPSHRAACWRQWTRVYSFGQPRDRIEYARRRISELANGTRKALSLNLEEEPGTEQRQFYLSVPGPTNAHAPPPPIATQVYQADKAPLPESAPPGGECSKECRELWQGCSTSNEACAEASGAGSTDLRKSTVTGNGERRTALPPKSSPSEKSGPTNPEKCDCETEYRECMRRCYE